MVRVRDPARLQETLVILGHRASVLIGVGEMVLGRVVNGASICQLQESERMQKKEQVVCGIRE